MHQERRHTTMQFVRACEGDDDARASFSPVLYDELRRIARRLLGRERPDHTLQPTALVHEAYLRLIDVEQLAAGTADAARADFLRMAARSMRNVLVDHARRHRAEKRGGSGRRVTFEDEAAALPADGHALLDLEAALQKVGAINPELAHMAELRLFAGLSVRELAQADGISLTVAKERWALARTMLTRLLEPDERASAGE